MGEHKLPYLLTYLLTYFYFKSIIFARRSAVTLNNASAYRITVGPYRVTDYQTNRLSS